MRQVALRSVIAVLLMCLPAFARYEGQFQRDLNVSGTNDLQVRSGSGNITIRAGGANRIHISARIHVSSWFGNSEAKVRKIEANPPIVQQGTLIKVGYLSDPDLRGVSIDYDITVPPDTRVVANTGSGNVEAQGLRNRLSVESGSGNLEVRDVVAEVRARTGSGNIRCDRVGAPFSAFTGSGNVEASLTGAGDVDLHAGSGNLTLVGASGGLRAKTGSGDVRIEGNPAGNWSLQAGSGSVRLRFPQQASFDLDAHAGSGDIHMARAISVQGRINQHMVQGRVGNGGPRVSVQTGSGNIELQ